MHIVGRPAIYAAQVLFSLFATNSALPATSQVTEQTSDFLINANLGHDRETLIRWPKGLPSSLETPTSHAVVPYTIPNTAITVNFTRFGSQIPAIRVISIIDKAHQQILPHLASNSENAIKNDLFECSTYSTPPGTPVCSVVVQAYRDLGLSWIQLDQILKGLEHFTSGAGIDRQFRHQSLEFEVNFSDKGTIGVGLLWCTPSRGRGAAEIKRAAEIPVRGQELDRRLNLIPGPPDTASLDLSNKSNVLSNLVTEVPFPVLGTGINLKFVWLGNPIPRKKINDILHGAFLKIAPFLKQSPKNPVPHERFVYFNTASRTQMAIQIFGMGKMSWSQVNSIMVGLYRFTNGIGTTHEQQYFRNLGFDVEDENHAKIGFGNLLDVSGAIITSAAANQKRSTLPSSTPLLLNTTTTIHLSHPTHALSIPSYPYIWHIPSTTLTLNFTYIGHALPAVDVTACLYTALDRTHAAAHHIPDRSIGDTGFENHIRSVQVEVTPYEGAEISWLQLGYVLVGLGNFCRNVYEGLLVFDVEVEGGGKIGAGSLWGYDGYGDGGVVGWGGRGGGGGRSAVVE